MDDDTPPTQKDLLSEEDNFPSAEDLRSSFTVGPATLEDLKKNILDSFERGCTGVKFRRPVLVTPEIVDFLRAKGFIVARYLPSKPNWIVGIEW